MKRLSILSFSICLICFIFRLNVQASEKLPVFVSIAPQKFFVQAIGGNFVDVSVMVAPGASPHTYEPSPAQMKKMAEAKIYFALGDPFEDIWLEKLKSVNSGIIIVRTDDGIAKRPISRDEKYLKLAPVTMSVHDHEHHLYDPHIWLSPPLVMLQARNILTGLINEIPRQRESLENSYKLFINQVVDLDVQLRNEFEKTRNKEFLVLHPSWGYFADAYNLRQIPIEIEGKEAKAKELQTIIEYAKGHEIKDIFVQPQFSKKQADMLAAEIKGRIIYADPLAENWIQNLKSVASSIKSALR